MLCLGIRPPATSGSYSAKLYTPYDHFLGEHIRSTAITVVDLTEVRKTGTGRVLERTPATVTKPDLKGFWVHLDVDVLDDALMPAVDYRHPGGLTWQEAAQILSGLLASDRARGLEVTSTRGSTLAGRSPSACPTSSPIPSRGPPVMEVRTGARNP